MAKVNVGEGSINNIIPLTNGWPGFLWQTDPNNVNYVDNAFGTYIFNGVNLLFTPKRAGNPLRGGSDDLYVGTSFDDARLFENIIASIYVVRKPFIRETLTNKTLSSTGSITLTITTITEDSGFGSNFPDTYIWLIDGVVQQSAPKVGDYLEPVTRVFYPYSTFTVNGSSLSAGEHTLTVRVSTAFGDATPGNVSSEQTITLTVTNNSPPSFTSGLSQLNLFSNRSKTVTVSATNAVSYAWSVDGITKQTSSDPSFILNGANFTVGEHTLKVVASNANGNVSSETTFMVNPVILASIAKNSSNNIINFPAGYLLLDAPGLTFTDDLGSYDFNTAAGILTFTPLTDITGNETLSMYSPTNQFGFATIVINVVEYPRITQGLVATLTLRQNETRIVSINAESATSYKWFVDNNEKQSGALNSFTVDGSTLTLGDHTLRVDASNENGTVSSSSVISVSASLPPPDAPTSITIKMESLTNIKVTWISSELVQYSFDNITYENTSGSSLNIPIIEMPVSSLVDQGAKYILVPQYAYVYLRAINAGGPSNVVTSTVKLPYTLEKVINNTVEQIYLTGFSNAGAEVNIVDGITHIYAQADTRGDLSIQTNTKRINIYGSIVEIRSEAFVNCAALESMSFKKTPPTYTNFVTTNGESAGYWNFFPNRLPAKVTVKYDSTRYEWDPIVTRITDPVSPYIVFSARPYIYGQLPTSATVVLNTDYLLSSKVYGSPLNFKWFEDGVEIPGATSSTFTVKKTSIGDLGVKNYYYQAYNDFSIDSNATSDEIAITFVSPPVINTELPTGIALLTANSQIIGPISVSGTQPFTYQWSVNGAPITGETSASLTLTGAMLPNIGNNTLSVTVTNAHGSVVKSVDVEKLSPPIVADLAAITVASNESKTITSSVTGTAPFTYSWKNASGTEVGTGESLTITGSSFDTVGDFTYTLTVTNTYGSAVKSVAIKITRESTNTISDLTANFGNVQTEASIVGNALGRPSTRILTPGDVTYSVTVSGYPRQTIEWRAINPATQAVTVIKTDTTTKETTASETFTLTRSYAAAGVREGIQVRVTNGTSDVKISNPIYVDTAEELRTAFYVRYKETFTAPSTPSYSVATGFTTNNEIPQINVSNPIYDDDKYILLWGDIRDELETGAVRTNSILNEIQANIIPASYLDRYKISYSYELAGETAFTPITMASSFYAGSINPLMFVIDRAKFPGLKKLNDKCVFRCEIDYKNTSFIGRKAATYYVELTVRELEFVTNDAGKLSNILGGNISTLEIPTYITAFSSDFRQNLRGTYQNGQSYDRSLEINTLILHKGIPKISEGTFRNCYQIKKISGLSPSVVLEPHAFDGCLTLEEVLFDTSA